MAQQIALDGWIAEYVAGRKPLQVTFAGPKCTAGTSEIVRPYAGQNQEKFVQHMRKFPPKTGKHLILSDWYPRNQNAARYLDTYPALAMKWLRYWFAEFDQGCFLEYSEQMQDGTIEEKPGRAPTVQECEAQLNYVMQENPVLIAFFTHNFRAGWDDSKFPNGWDGSSPELIAKRREITKRLLNIVDVPKPDAEIDKLKLRIDQLEFNAKELTAQVSELQSKAITSVEVKRG